MIETSLQLPPRAVRPRRTGLTVVIDNGMPSGLFADALTSAAEYVDLVKFGWGTAVVTNDLVDKIALLRRLGVGHYFGGTLFEKHVLQGRFEAFRDLCHRYACKHVEVSNGVIDLTNAEKAAYVAALAGEFDVISEVGFKDASRSENLRSDAWIAAIEEDLAAGARLVTTEARESGRSGVCRANGELRHELLEDLLAGRLDTSRLLFEAPTTELQAFFVRHVGPDANLANVPALGVLGLETLRLGLRADTLTAFEPALSAGVVQPG